MEITNSPPKLPEQALAKRPSVEAMLNDIDEIHNEKISPALLKRLELLNELTETVMDAHRMVKIARKFVEYYGKKEDKDSFTEAQKKTIAGGVFFSDIGKTGPAKATPEQQRLIVEMFAIENVGANIKTMTVADFLHQFFGDDSERRINRFEELIDSFIQELDLDNSWDRELVRILRLGSFMTMRNFYNLHGRWTKDIVENNGVPPEAIGAASTHQVLEGVNKEIVGEHGEFKGNFGENKSFDWEEKIIIVWDKFDAVIRRSKKSYKEAIEYLRGLLKNNPKYADDEEFKTILDDLESFVKDEAEFIDAHYSIEPK